MDLYGIFMDFESSNGPSGGERREHFGAGVISMFWMKDGEPKSHEWSFPNNMIVTLSYSECLMEISTVFHEIYCRWDLDGIELTNMGGLKLTSLLGE